MAQAQAATTTIGESEIRLRPPWLVALLEIVSENLYEVWWYARTWMELKRARSDPSMHPVWHTLAMFVPIYGLFRLHAHYRVLNETAASAGATDRTSPGLMVILAIVRGVAGAIAVSIAVSIIMPVMVDMVNAIAANPKAPPLTPTFVMPPSLLLLSLAGIAIGAWQLYRGQEVLNAYYVTRPAAPAPAVLTLEWVFVALFALRFLSDLLQYVRR